MNVVVSGAFDMFHPGHLDFLRCARAIGDRLIVAVNSDVMVSAAKPGRPIFTEAERLIMVSACRYVDLATVFYSEQELADLTRDFATCIRVVGEDHERVTGAEFAADVIRLPRGDYSTTAIIERLTRGHS